MNRVTITLDEQGNFIKLCSDEPVEIYIVAPHVPHDRVYLYSSVDIGPQHVQKEIGGYPVGHKDDGTFSKSPIISPHRLPPSRTRLTVVSDKGSE